MENLGASKWSCLLELPIDKLSLFGIGAKCLHMRDNPVFTVVPEHAYDILLSYNIVLGVWYVYFCSSVWCGMVCLLLSEYNTVILETPF